MIVLFEGKKEMKKINVEKRMCHEFEIDVRKPPDRYRKREFRTGWRNSLSTDPKDEYTKKKLKKLPWNNLGYRLAKLFRDTPEEMIEELYDWSVRHYQNQKKS